MIRGLYNSASGMMVEQRRQEVLANNLANINTDGFKREISILRSRAPMNIRRTHDPQQGGNPIANMLGLPNQAQPPRIGELGTGVVFDAAVLRFDHGLMRQTDEPFDVALNDSNTFLVSAEEPSGKERYTRDGHLGIGSDGYLTDRDGRHVMGENGPIRILDERGRPPGERGRGLKDFLIAEDGTVSLNGRDLGKLRLVTFESPSFQLLKMGDNDFSAVEGATPIPATDPRVAQGFLEGSNVNGIRELVDMITLMRAYEANQRALTGQDETLRQAVTDLARV